jgi:DNA-binding transcriptional LysR family regulator
MADTFDEWRSFVAVARGKSFVRAARELGKSPQAMTRAVAALEARLGVRLFHRTTRAVSLTDDGARLVERARRVIDDVHALEEPGAKDVTGTLVVTAPVLFGQLHVVPVVAELLAVHAKLDARLLLVDRVVSLADEGVDVAVRIGALPDSSLLARAVGRVRTVVCASPRYLAKHGTPKTPEDLAEHACIAFTGVTPVVDRWSFPARPRDRTARVRPRLVVNTGQAALDAAVDGLGIARLVSYQVASAVAHKKLRVILVDHEPAPSPVHLVWPPGLRSRAAGVFVDLAAARLKSTLAR